jgi:hypothetical protein
MEMRGKNRLKHKIFIFGFQCVTKNMEGWLNICTSYLIYNQICLNFSSDDCHFN